MALQYRELVRGLLFRYLEAPGIRALTALRVTPNGLTLMGFVLAVAAAYLIGSDRWIAGGIVFLLSGIMDLMDGALARARRVESKAGALLDSTIDRLAEAALFLGLAIHGVLRETEGRLLAFIILVILALVSSQMVSYLRARGEGLGIETKVGFVTRPERVVLLSLGVFLGGLGVDLAVEAALGAIAGLSTFTLFQRLFHVWRSLEKK